MNYKNLMEESANLKEKTWINYKKYNKVHEHVHEQDINIGMEVKLDRIIFRLLTVPNVDYRVLAADLCKILGFKGKIQYKQDTKELIFLVDTENHQNK